MLYTWATLIGKILAFYFIAILFLNGSKQYLAQIPLYQLICVQTAKAEVPSIKAQVDSKKNVLTRPQLIKFDYPRHKTRKSNVFHSNNHPDKRIKKEFRLSQIKVVPNFSDNVTENIENQTIPPFSVPITKISPFNKKDQIIKEDRYLTPPPPPLRSNVPRVALLLPLSGPHSNLGQAFLNAAQLALFHFADKEFELIPQDTMGTPLGAADAAALAIGDGASLILGPLFSSSVTAIKDAVIAAGISVISFTNDRDVASTNIFTMGFLPSEQVERIVGFAFKKGLRNFALLAPENRYGEEVSRTFALLANTLGITVTNVAFYDPNSGDFGPVVRNLANYDKRRKNLIEQRKVLAERDDEIAKNALKKLENLQTLGDLPFDALMVADGGERLQAIAALLPYYDIDPKKTRLLGTELWDNKKLTSEPALAGGWFVAPPKKERQSFIKNYIEMYGSAPPRLATLAYDATALAAVFVKSDGSFDPAELTTPEGFGGRDGIFRFSTQGYSNRGLSVYEIEERNVKVIETAPSSFKDLTD